MSLGDAGGPVVGVSVQQFRIYLFHAFLLTATPLYSRLFCQSSAEVSSHVSQLRFNEEKYESFNEFSNYVLGTCYGGDVY